MQDGLSRESDFAEFQLFALLVKCDFQNTVLAQDIYILYKTFSNILRIIPEFLRSI